MGIHNASSDPDDGTDNEEVIEKSPKPPSQTKLAKLSKLEGAIILKQRKGEDFSKEAEEHTKIMKTIDPDYDGDILKGDHAH